MAGAVGRRTRALRDPLAEMRGHAAERALINFPVIGARERHAVVLEFDDGGRRPLAHELDGVLVAEPIRALDRVIHMPAPVVGAHVAECRGDTSLRRHGVAAGGKDFGQACRGQTCFRKPEGRAQARAAGADHHHVIGVIDEFVFAHNRVNPNAMRRMANMHAPQTSTWAKRSSNSDTTLVPEWT
jgi:hypothetical protein